MCFALFYIWWMSGAEVVCSCTIVLPLALVL